MDSVNVCCQSDLDDVINIKICVNRSLFRVQRIGFICFGTEECITVFLGINADGCDSKLVQGSEYTDGDLATICYQNFFELSDLYLIVHVSYSFYQLK